MNKQSKQVNQWNEAVEKVRTFMMNQNVSLILKNFFWKKKDIKNHDLFIFCVESNFYFILFIFYFFYYLKYCIGFAIHQHASATGVHMFPSQNGCNPKVYRQ